MMSSSAPKKKPGRPRTKGVAAPAPSRTNAVKRSVTLDDLPAIQVEGGLFTIEHVRKVQRITADHQAAAQYDLAPGLELKQEISRAFTIGAALWADFESSRAGAGDKTEATRRFLDRFLKDVLGFADLRPFVPRGDGPQHYPLTFQTFASAVPLVLAGAHHDIDKPDDAFGDGFRRRSPHQLLQEYLNWDEGALWGICSNGTVLRVLRDSDSLTRQSCFEANLERIFGEELLADFSVLWLHAHASRFKPGVAGPASCILEQWHQSSQEEGSRVRDSLRIGVERAMVDLGTGFLEHRSNAALRDALSSGAMRLEDFHQEVLRLVYRMLFLLAVEDRRQLHPASATKEQLDLYAQGYSLTRLRQRSIRHCADRHDDIWDSLRVAFRGLAKGESALGLPALGGLFADQQCPTIDKLLISNKRLLAALRAITWFRENDALVPVNYKSMGTEELGSVYESLLELTPSIGDDGKSFGFITADEDEGKGSNRKTSGSYYTPDSLVQQLLDTTLDPVVADRLKGKSTKAEKEKAILSITVIDPACGSGHFLLGAARRLAEKLASIRAEGGEATDYRGALRDVIASCIHGVDRNPMAIQLAKVALWLEGYVADKPLSFLDHHLVVGDSILSIVDLDMATKGIPDEAYEVITGDDKTVARALKARNKTARDSELKVKQGTMDLFGGTEVDMGKSFAKIDVLSDDTLDGVARKVGQLEIFIKEAQADWRVRAAKLYLGAFLLPKVQGSRIPTSADILSAMNGEDLREVLPGVEAAFDKSKALIWPLSFPRIFERGGFDVVLGNPPWVKITLSEIDFFSSSLPAVSTLSKAKRAVEIEKLKLSPEGSISRGLYESFIKAKIEAEASSKYAHSPDRYPLTGKGDVNLYALFSETSYLLKNRTGRVGLVVPTGIATDKSTESFFDHLFTNGQIVLFCSFDNKKKLFRDILGHIKFALLTIGSSRDPKFVFLASSITELADSRKQLILNKEDLALINPNTRTLPILRSALDLDLVRKLYKNNEILISKEGQNSWDVRLFTMFHMTGDEHCFLHEKSEGSLPLYEANMIQLYDHRFGFFDIRGEAQRSDLTAKCNVSYEANPRYWVSRFDVCVKLYPELRQAVEAYKAKSPELKFELSRVILMLCPTARGLTEATRSKWFVETDLCREEEALVGAALLQVALPRIFDEVDPTKALELLVSVLTPNYFIGWRDITNDANQRTLLCSFYPASGSGHTINNIYCGLGATYAACLVAQLSSLVCDYIVRCKLGGTHLTHSYMEQVPVVSPKKFSEAAREFVVQRVAELVYTSHQMAPLYNELQADKSVSLPTRSEPFSFDENRRLVLKSELDAYIAHLFGLSRDDLAFILSPASLLGSEYPSQTFSGLESKEVREFGEYRTQRLVLEAWDRIIEPLRRGQS